MYMSPSLKCVAAFSLLNGPGSCRKPNVSPERVLCHVLKKLPFSSKFGWLLWMCNQLRKIMVPFQTTMFRILCHWISPWHLKVNRTRLLFSGWLWIYRCKFNRWFPFTICILSNFARVLLISLASTLNSFPLYCNVSFWSRRTACMVELVELVKRHAKVSEQWLIQRFGSCLFFNAFKMNYRLFCRGDSLSI